jgi:large subunit ribosomal protein L4
MQTFSSTMRANAVVQRPQRTVSRVQTITRASVVAEPASLDVKKADGSSSGKASLSLKIADPETANGLVHRYVVMVRQNMRQVRIY